MGNDLIFGSLNFIREIIKTSKGRDSLTLWKFFVRNLEDFDFSLRKQNNKIEI